MTNTDWDFPTLAGVWEYRDGTILAGGDRLDSLDGPDRERCLAALHDRVEMLTAGLDDGWLLMTAVWMVEDVYKSFFRAFGWTPGVHDYLAATGAVVMAELARRGFVLHYVVDATQPPQNLVTLLEYLPSVFRAAGLAVVGPQLAALQIVKQEQGGPPADISEIQPYRDDGLAIADEVVAQWHRDRQSSVYLNLDLDDGLPGLALDAAVSPAGEPGTLVLFRSKPPAEGSAAEVFPPPGVTLPAVPPGMHLT